MAVTPAEVEKIIGIAKKARGSAFTPRSGHKIGACLLSTDGGYFPGCNVESIITGMGECAERAAVSHAIVHGQYQFKAVAVVDEPPTFPCGACLQYLLMFHQVSGQEIEVIVAGLDGSYEIYPLTKLLPHGYLTKGRLDELKSYGRK